MTTSSEHHHTAAEKKALRVRLRKIAGQVRAIETLLEQDSECTEVLTQLVSVRKALKSLAEVIIHQHVHQCIEGTTDPKEAKKKLRELLIVLQRYVE